MSSFVKGWNMMIFHGSWINNILLFSLCLNLSLGKHERRSQDLLGSVNDLWHLVSDRTQTPVSCVEARNNKTTFGYFFTQPLFLWNSFLWACSAPLCCPDFSFGTKLLWTELRAPYSVAHDSDFQCNVVPVKTTSTSVNQYLRSIYAQSYLQRRQKQRMVCEGKRRERVLMLSSTVSSDECSKLAMNNGQGGAGSGCAVGHRQRQKYVESICVCQNSRCDSFKSCQHNQCWFVKLNLDSPPKWLVLATHLQVNISVVLSWNVWVLTKVQYEWITFN